MRPINLRVVWLGMINNLNGTVGWGLSRNEWDEKHVNVTFQRLTGLKAL